MRKPHRPFSAQRGVSLVNLIMLLIVLGLIAVLGMKVVPTITEYRAVKKGIEQAQERGRSAIEIRRNFDRYADASYISSISGSDLLVERINGKFYVSFEYQKKVSLVGPASLVIDYEGTTKPLNLQK